MCENGEIPEAVLQQASKVQADFLVLGLAGYTYESLLIIIGLIASALLVQSTVVAGKCRM